MSATPSAASATRPPVLIELDPEFWQGQLDRTETFLGTVVVMQSSFRTLADDTAAKVRQPQFHHFLQQVAHDAHRHEEQLGAFYRMIGRDPARGRATLGTVAAKGREVLSDIEGFASGTSSPWRDLRQLWMSSHSSEGAFGVVEQLGYALGMQQFAELAFRLVNEKHRATLLIQELVLEMAAPAVLYEGSTESAFGPRTSETGPFLPDRG